MPGPQTLTGAAGADETLRSPVAPLRDALAGGYARFGTATIEAAPAPGRIRLEKRLRALLGAFPDIAVGGDGIRHSEPTGLYFAALRIGEGHYLASLGATSAPPLRPGQPILAVTGRCMFGIGAITASPGGDTLALLQQNNAFTDPSHTIERITVDSRLHLYEREGTARIVGFLRNLAAVPGMGPIHVRAHFPVPEYQLHGFHLYARGLMTEAALGSYRGHIRKRGRELQRALAAALGPRVTLTTWSPLAWIDQAPIPEGDPGPALWEAALRRSHWQHSSRRLWRVLAGLRPDDSLEALSYASYSYTYLAAAISAAQRRQALIFAEDVEEESLLRRTLPAADAAGVPLRQAAGFYLHPDLVALTIQPGSDGYYLFNVPSGCGVKGPT